MTSKLAVYNLALGHLKERSLASLSENREPRRVLDSFWAQVTEECLAAGAWNHAMRSVALTPSSSVVPAFGYDYAFTIPDDWVRTVHVSDEPQFRRALADYRDEGGYWLASAAVLYVRYISNGAQFGSDLSRWTPNYTAYVAFKLAEYSCGRIADKEELLAGPSGIVKRGNKAKAQAKLIDALDESPPTMQRGSWVRSRTAGLSDMPGGDRFDD